MFRTIRFPKDVSKLDHTRHEIVGAAIFIHKSIDGKGSDWPIGAFGIICARMIDKSFDLPTSITAGTGRRAETRKFSISPVNSARSAHDCEKS